MIEETGVLCTECALLPKTEYGRRIGELKNRASPNSIVHHRMSPIKNNSEIEDIIVDQ
jgi:hypothetical protein